ncbi:MAG: zinc ribbon domain-containing protein [Lentisphaeria bacterium]|nr:zinc ribbon domain-containing protein [Lentisphaeria bacterium]
MPIFEYECGKCRKKFELLLPNASAPAKCPHCGSDKLKKLLSSFSAKVDSSPASSCAHADLCPGAGTPSCGCGCGCGGHHHHH